MRRLFGHDGLGPRVGQLLALKREEPVSFFRPTDEEKRLSNISWNIVRPLHTRDWISGTLIQGQRTRIFPDISDKLDYRAYLFWIRLQPFRSSETRWNRIISDIRADQGDVSPFYDQARLVYIIDRERIVYLEETEGLSPDYRASTQARIKENENLIKVALDSMNFRYEAYDYAIRNLTAESPSARAQVARDELERYRDLVEKGGVNARPFFDAQDILSSRIKLQTQLDEVVKQK